MAEADVSLKNALPFGAVGLFFVVLPGPAQSQRHGKASWHRCLGPWWDVRWALASCFPHVDDNEEGNWSV